MKFLLMGDFHEQTTSPRSRSDNFQESKNEKIKEIIKIKNDNNIDYILQPGDFYDTPSLPTNHLISQYLLWAGIEKENNGSLSKSNISLIEASKTFPKMIGVLGNHEMPGGNFNEESHKVTPYHLFEKIGLSLMNFVSKENPLFLETEDGLKIAITGTKYHLDIDKPGNEDDYIVEEKLGDVHIHIVHGYLTEKYKGKMFHHTLVKDIAHKTKADITFTGHDHIGFDLMEVDGKYFLNPGAILRLSNDKKEIKREIKVVSLEITKDKGIVFKNIPLQSAKPGKDILDRKKIEKMKENKRRLEEFKQKVRASSNSQSTNIINFLNSYKDNPLLQFPQEIIENAIKRVTDKKIANTIEKREVKPYRVNKLILKNFESHKDTTIEFDDNLNILIGESGHGKSSILRAIQWVVENNPAGRSMVRVGESKTSVTMVLSNGYEITRYVTKSKNGYSITDSDGLTTEYNTKALSEVQAILGFTQVRIDKDMIYNFNFSNQGEGWFLIGKDFTAPARSKIIGSIYGTQHADSSVREIKSEISTIRDKNKQAYERKDIIEKELEKYDYLNTLDNQIKFLELKIKDINKLKEEKEKIENVLKRYSFKQEQLNEVQETLKQLPDINALKIMLYELKEKYTQQELLETKTKQINRYKEMINNTKIAISQTDNLDKYKSLVSRMKIAEENKNKIENILHNYTNKTKLLKDEIVILDETNSIEVNKKLINSLKEQFLLKNNLDNLLPLYIKNKKGLNNILLSIDATENLSKAKDDMKFLYNTINVIDKTNELIVQYQKNKKGLNDILLSINATENLLKAKDDMKFLYDTIKSIDRIKELNHQHQKITKQIEQENIIISEQNKIFEKAIYDYNEELKISKACPTCFTPITEETTKRILAKFKGGNI